MWSEIEVIEEVGQSQNHHWENRVVVADVLCCATTHVAAQYGQTAFLYHVVSKWNADPDVPDNDGRSPLHWAAYKGFADCIRLLLFLDAYRGRQDKERCTPLHRAAIRGNLEACTVLVQGGKKEDLIVTDITGHTPAQLASYKNHRQVAFFLVASNLPKLTAGFVLFAWLGFFLSAGGLVMFYRCSSPSSSPSSSPATSFGYSYMKLQKCWKPIDHVKDCHTQIVYGFHTLSLDHIG
ncbi:hypothetical protein EZV62_013285 [Acer yangbiense]|uniref:Uncharacterized protein n=1 Tax=Acer yangbiense TaxID=1000413 RepID=A0A5C7I0J6_9ROSI|nr:hypothetical protein EZV62_013285 [Acer yangbiense]